MDNNLYIEYINHLENYRQLTQSLNMILQRCELECLDVINCISSCSLEESMKYFDRLHLIQRQLSIAKWKFNYPLWEKIDNFVHNFDRDDEYSRTFWYKKINADVASPFNK